MAATRGSGFLIIFLLNFIPSVVARTAGLPVLAPRPLAQGPDHGGDKADEAAQPYQEHQAPREDEHDEDVGRTLNPEGLAQGAQAERQKDQKQAGRQDLVAHLSLT
jgi:hypothetical protein